MRYVASRSNGAFPASVQIPHESRDSLLISFSTRCYRLSWRPELQQNCEDQQRVKPCADIVKHDAETLRQAFQSTQGRRFENVEATKKYKAQQQIFPTQRRDDERQHLSRNFIDYHKGGIFSAALARNSRAGCNSNQSHRDRGDKRDERSVSCSICAQPPEQHGNDRSPRPWTRAKLANSKERGDKPCPARVGGCTLHASAACAHRRRVSLADAARFPRATRDRAPES